MFQLTKETSKVAHYIRLEVEFRLYYLQTIVRISAKVNIANVGVKSLSQYINIRIGAGKVRSSSLDRNDCSSAKRFKVRDSSVPLNRVFSAIQLFGN